jgi:hypothetical protein
VLVLSGRTGGDVPNTLGHGHRSTGQNQIAELLDLKIVARSDPRNEAVVHEAFHDAADRFSGGGDLTQAADPGLEPPGS